MLGFSACFGFFYELSIAFLTAAAHELAHLLTALMLKEKCFGAALMPYGAKLYLRPSRHIRNEALICAAGPVFNLIMLFLFPEGPFFEMNLSMLFINLFPALPTDGGRLLYLLLSMKSPFFALGCMKKISLFSGLLMLAAGIYQAYSTGFNLSLFLIGMLLLSKAADKGEDIRLYLSRCTKEPRAPSSPAHARSLAVRADTPARRLIPLLAPGRVTFFDCLSDEGGFLFRLSEGDVIRAVQRNGSATIISEIGKNA